MIIVQEEEEEGEVGVQKKEVEEVRAIVTGEPKLSIHVLEGTFNYQTMMLKGLVGRRVLCILIDFGSTHNFINARIARKLGCVMEYIHELKVLTANGNELQCNERCRRFSWAMQRQNFETDVLSLPLDNYDLVLGVQLLVKLEDIIWNFKKLQMRFIKDGKEHVL